MKTQPKKSLLDTLYPPFFLTFMFLIFGTMITTCTFHDEMKYTNIEHKLVKMVVTGEIVSSGPRYESFYYRVKSPFIVTPEPDYLISSQMCPTAREKDTIVCYVKTSTTLRNAWYSPLADMGDRDVINPNQNLFSILCVTEVIKPK